MLLKIAIYISIKELGLSDEVNSIFFLQKGNHKEANFTFKKNKQARHVSKKKKEGQIRDFSRIWVNALPIKLAPTLKLDTFQ